MKEEENKMNDYALVRVASYYGRYRNDSSKLWETNEDGWTL